MARYTCSAQRDGLSLTASDQPSQSPAWGVGLSDTERAGTPWYGFKRRDTADEESAREARSEQTLKRKKQKEAVRRAAGKTATSVEKEAMAWEPGPRRTRTRAVRGHRAAGGRPWLAVLCPEQPWTPVHFSSAGSAPSQR